MQWKQPKNNEKYQWTQHSLFKMRYYTLSAQKVLGVIKRPTRKEEGIVKNTIAVMQPVNPKIQNGKKIWKQEVWVMYQIKRITNKELRIKNTKKEKLKQISAEGGPAVGRHNSKFIIHDSAKRQLRIISAWRYPGVSPQKNPIPEDILAEIGSLI